MLIKMVEKKGGEGGGGRGERKKGQARGVRGDGKMGLAGGESNP